MVAWFVKQQLDPESFNNQMVHRLFHEKGSRSMDIAALLQRIQQKCDYAGQLEHVEILPEQEGSFSEPLQPLHEATSRLLAQRNIEQLYAHQVSALVASRLGQDLVVVTGTASGKTLAYNLPILETVFSARDARALYLFPTKALAQDQLKGLLEIVADDPSWKSAVRPGVHDGPCQRNLQQTLHKKRLRPYLVRHKPQPFVMTKLPADCDGVESLEE